MNDKKYETKNLYFTPRLMKQLEGGETENEILNYTKISQQIFS